jgi:hypothetical protein
MVYVCREVLNEIGFIWSEPQKKTIIRKNRMEMEKEDSVKLKEKMDSLLASLGKGSAAGPEDTAPMPEPEVNRKKQVG